MTKVTYITGANRSVGCYGKGQSILVNSFKKNPKLENSESKIARKGKAA